MFLRFTHVAVCVSTSLWLNDMSLQGYTSILFIYSSVDGDLGCFYFLAIMNNAAMSTHVQVFVQTHVFNSFGKIPRIGIARSYGDSMFNLLRTC